MWDQYGTSTVGICKVLIYADQQTQLQVRPGPGAGHVFVEGAAGSAPSYITVAAFTPANVVVCWTTTTSRACRVGLYTATTEFLSFPLLAGFYRVDGNLQQLGCLYVSNGGDML